MPSCLSVEIIYAKLNVTTIFPDRAGPTGGPARAEILTAAGAGQGHGQGHADARMVDDEHTTSTSRPINSPGPSPRCGDKLIIYWIV